MTSRSRFDSLAGLGLCLMVGASLLGSPGLTGRESGWVLMMGGVATLYLGFIWERLVSRPSPTGAEWLAVLLLAWSWLTGVVSLDPYLTQRSLAALSCGVSVMLLASVIARSRRAWRGLVYCLVALASTSALYAWYRAATSSQWGGRLAGNFTNPDSFAVILFVGFCLAAGQLDRRKGGVNLVPAACSGLLLTTLVATQSRSAIAALSVAFVVMALGSDGRSRRSVGRAAGYLSLTLIPAAVFIVVSGKLDAVLGRLKALTANPFDIPLRLEVLQTSMKCALARPILGSGPGTFHLAYQQFRPLNTPTHQYMNVAHNDSLQFLVEAGLPGMVLWLALLLLTAKSCWRARREVEILWCLSCLGGLFTFSLFNFIVPVTTTSIWLFIVAGLSLARSGYREESPIQSRWRIVVSGILVLAGVATTFTGLRLVTAQAAENDALKLRQELKWREASQALDRAVQAEPNNPIHRLHRARLVQEMATLFGRAEWLEQAEYDVGRAMKLSPRNLACLSAGFHYHLEHGNLLRARHIAETARRFAPYDKRFLRRLAGVQVLQGQLHEASQTLQEEAGDTAGTLGPLIYYLEQSSPGEGIQVLTALPSKDLRRVALQARKLALKERDQAFLSQTYQLLLPLEAANSVCLSLSQANDLGALGATNDQLALLETICQPANESKSCYEEALIAWSKVAGNSAAPRLRAYLLSHPNQVDARLAACELLEPQEAVKLIDEGLELHPTNVKLLSKQGDLFARDGLKDIAKNYYLRALAQGGDRRMLESRIMRLENK